jgi:hypothetical protein
MEGIQCNMGFGYQPGCGLGPRKTTVNLDGLGRSQNFPEAYRLLASSPIIQPIPQIKRTSPLQRSVG